MTDRQMTHCAIGVTDSVVGQKLILLVGWQEGHPVCKKAEWWDSVVVIYLLEGAMAQLMPLPLTISCSSESRLVLLSWLVLPAHLGSPRQGPGGCEMVVVL